MGRFLTCLHSRRCSKKPIFTWSSCHPEKEPEAVPLRHAYYHDYKFYWVLLKILGLFPYHIDKKGNVIFKWCSKEMVYSLAMYCTTSIPVGMVLGLRYSQKRETFRDFDRKMHVYMMALVMLPHLVIPSSHWAEMPRFQSTFKSWRKFQATYEEVMDQKLSLRAYWWSNIFLLSLLFVSCIILMIDILFISYEYVWEEVAHVYILTIHVLHMLPLIGISCRLMRVAREIRFKLLQAIKAEDVAYVERIANLWISLSENTKLVGTIFYRMYSKLFLMMFALATITMYSCLKALGKSRDGVQVFFHLCNLINNNLWTYIVCECGENVAVEIGHKFTLHLSKIRGSVKTPEMKYELDSFLCTISSFPPAITFNNYVTLNRRLLVSVNSTMVTYLIVVLQFSQDYPKLPVDSCLSSNGSTSQ